MSDSRKRTQIAGWTLFVVSVTVITAVDLWSKARVFELLQVQSVDDPPVVAYQVPYVIWEGFFELEATYNRGAFSGWFSGHTFKLALLSIAAMLIITGIVFVSLRQKVLPTLWFILALGLVGGGTLGNLYDRYYLHAVRDWIKWFVVIDGKPRVWPNFNVADSGICVGVGLLILLEILTALRSRRQEATTDGVPASAARARD